MAAIQTGTINFDQVFTGDLFDVTIEIDYIDLSGMELEMVVFDDPDVDPILTFSEEDGSLTKVVNSSTKTTVRLLKQATDMQIPVLSEDSPDNQYHHLIRMFSSTENRQTILTGYVAVVNE